MPVAPVDASHAQDPSGPSRARRPFPGAGPGSAPAFDAVLAARMRDPALLPTVTMDEMVSALAGRPLGSAGGAGASLAGFGGIAPAAGTAAVRDPWGAAADRPSRIEDGPGAAVLMAGERYLGVPYRWGGTDPATGFDCSGFVQQVYADLGIRLPRVSVDQAREGVAVADLASARPGDLVFWRGDGSRPNHIGIYAGEGRMLVAPRTGDVVRYQEITRTPDAIRRVLP